MLIKLMSRSKGKGMALMKSLQHLCCNEYNQSDICLDHVVYPPG